MRPPGLLPGRQSHPAPGGQVRREQHRPPDRHLSLRWRPADQLGLRSHTRPATAQLWDIGTACSLNPEAVTEPLLSSSHSSLLRAEASRAGRPKRRSILSDTADGHAAGTIIICGSSARVRRGPDLCHLPTGAFHEIRPTNRATAARTALHRYLVEQTISSGLFARSACTRYTAVTSALTPHPLPRSMTPQRKLGHKLTIGPNPSPAAFRPKRRRRARPSSLLFRNRSSLGPSSRSERASTKFD